MVAQMIIGISSTFLTLDFKPRILNSFESIISSIFYKLIFMEKNIQLNLDVFIIIEIFYMINPMILALRMFLYYAVFYIEIDVFFVVFANYDFSQLA